MSRDFKLEYTQYMNEQTPDLWARIEANLPAKEVPATTLNELRERRASKRFSPKTGRILTYGISAAAALLICFVALPAVRVLTPKGETANMTAFDAAGMRTSYEYGADNEAVQEAVQEEGALEAEEETILEMVTVTEDNAEAANGATSAEDAGVAEATPAEKYADEAESMKTDSMADTVAESERNGGASAASAEWSVVSAVVLDCYEIDGKIVYSANIEGEEKKLVFGTYFSEDAALLAGEKYELVLEKAPEGSDWDYVIVEMR